MKLRPWHLAGIVIPILVIAGWIGTYVFGSKTGMVVTLPIEGFDPRDLLSGHYLRYRVDYGMDVKCKSREKLTACLRPAEDGMWRAWQFIPQVEAPPCDVFLQGECKHGRFDAGIERYYFPEKYTRELAVVPPASTIDVAITEKGKGIVKAMHVGGKPVVEWAREQYRKISEP